MSQAQVETWNWERRRKALVSNSAWIRLESAMRTGIAAVGAAGDGSGNPELRTGMESAKRHHLRGARHRTQGNMTQNLVHTLKSGQTVAKLWKTALRLWFGRRSRCMTVFH